MTDTDRMLSWLREALAAAEHDAKAATPGPWSVDDERYAEAIRSADGVDVVAGGRWGGEASVFESTADAKLIAAHASPTAVLRRIAADRERLEDCENILAGWHYEETKTLAEDVIRNLAEAWGWTEETT